MQALQQAIHDVSVYENHIDVICSIHKECSEVIDWESISDSKVPTKPEISSYNENLAREKSKSYKPNFFDKLFKRESKLRAELYSNIEKSIELDKIKNKQLKVDWENNKKQWNENIDFAKAVISGNYDKKIAILKQIDPFSEISNLGSNIDFFIMKAVYLKFLFMFMGAISFLNKRRLYYKVANYQVKQCLRDSFMKYTKIMYVALY